MFAISGVSNPDNNEVLCELRCNELPSERFPPA